ncbi:MAG: hypothetical protein V4610_14520 [Pseudomonadota bacterium]|jgi:hypothetical protein|uniref:Uncharacterized protein n=1 Tax=hydrothermal vent metagenome TaxID=652676 RepID=A0A161K0H4_9ZZZZ
MTTFKILAAAGLVALATIPVMAQAADGRPEPAANAPADAAATASKKKFCVVEATTGSRVAKKICRTRTEWLALGFDPTSK